MIRLGIIGFGKMGGYHARCAQSLSDEIKLCFIVDPHLSDIPYDNVTCVASHEEMYGHVDAVIIATPTTTHYHIAKDFLQRGVHVLVEKPITSTREQAAHLFSLAQKHNLVLHVGHVERFNAGLLHARPFVTTPRLIRSVRSGPFSSRVAHDSVALDLMIHDVDIILSLIPSPLKSISAHGSHIVSQTADCAAATLFFQNGSIAQLSTYRNAPIASREMTIEQDDATIHIDYASQRATIYHTDKKSETLEKKEGHNPLLEEIRFFAAAITAQAPQCTRQHDRAVINTTLDICHAIEQARTHQKQPPLQHEISDGNA